MGDKENIPYTSYRGIFRKASAIWLFFHISYRGSYIVGEDFMHEFPSFARVTADITPFYFLYWGKLIA